MKICFDWQAIRKGLVCEPQRSATAGQLCAEQIRDEIAAGGYAPDDLFGKAPDICRQYGLGRETLLETVRLLENWGVAQMRRGSRGGLVVMKRPPANPVGRLSRYFLLRGLSPAQISEARAVIDLAYRYCREQPTDQGSPFNRQFQLMLAAPHPFATQQAPARPDGDSRIGKCLRLFSDALNTIEQAANADRSSATRATGAKASCGTPSLARHVVYLLAGEIASQDRDGGARVHSEAAITAFMGVSRQVTRQAMRILQDEGLVQCRRGRSGGISVLADHPAPIIDLLTRQYGSFGLTRHDFVPILSMVGRANRILCGARASERDLAKLTTMTAAQRANDPASHVHRMRLEWQIMQNPALSLLEQSLAAYRATVAGNRVSTGFGDLQYLSDCTLGQIQAMRERNFARADCLMLDMQGEIARITGTF